MKFLRHVLLIVLMLSLRVAGQKSKNAKNATNPAKVDCKKLPGTPRSMLGCCNYPFVQHDESSIKCFETIDYHKGPNLAANCMSHTCALLKVQEQNPAFTEKQFLDYVLENFVFWKWVNISKSFTDECKTKALSEDTTIYTKPPFNVDPEKCYLPYLSYATCIYTKGFANCEGDLWLKTRACNNWKNFFSTCNSLQIVPKMLDLMPFQNF